MHITRLELKGFRNYDFLEIEPGSRLNVIWGPNAAGKTSILEAILYASTGRSPRAANESEMVKWGGRYFHLRMNAQRNTGTVTLEVGYEVGGKRLLRVNGTSQRPGSAVLGKVCVVTFFPPDVYLIRGSPAMRRRFLDLTLSQVSRAYHQSLVEYQKVVLNKNNLLKQYFGKPMDNALLEPWDSQLVTLGSYIIRKRLEALSRISVWARETHLSLSGGEELSMTYVSSVDAVDRPECEGEDGIARALHEALSRKRNEERRLCVSIVGPHRDDIRFYIDGKDARAFASQGQQRSAAVSLKTAEVRLMEHETGETPVFLMDDVLSELDPTRQRAISEIVMAGTQTFITTTEPPDRTHSSGLISDDVCGRFKVFKVEAGRVTESCNA